MSEIEQEQKCRELATRWDCAYRKMKIVAENGFPDRVLFVPDYRSKTERAELIFVEHKKPGEQPSELQKSKLTDLRQMGFTAVWLDSFGKFQMLMAAWIKDFD